MNKDVYSKLVETLSSTTMSLHEIKTIKVTKSLNKSIDMSYAIELDVHGYSVTQVNEILLKILSIKSPYIASIKIIHGYNMGRGIKDFLTLEFNHERVTSKIPDSGNLGITNLYVRQIPKSNNKKKSIKKILKKPIVKSSSKNSKELFDENDFLLTMIKEKIRGVSSGSRNFDYTYSKFLLEEEYNYCKGIAEFEIDVNFFVNHVMGYYQEGEKKHLLLKIKSVDQLKKSDALDKIKNHFSYKECTIILMVKKKSFKEVTEYIKSKQLNIKVIT